MRRHCSGCSPSCALLLLPLIAPLFVLVLLSCLLLLSDDGIALVSASFMYVDPEKAHKVFRTALSKSHPDRFSEIVLAHPDRRLNLDNMRADDYCSKTLFNDSLQIGWMAAPLDADEANFIFEQWNPRVYVNVGIIDYEMGPLGKGVFWAAYGPESSRYEVYPHCGISSLVTKNNYCSKKSQTPDNSNGAEHCLSMTRFSSSWWDLKCQSGTPFLCMFDTNNSACCMYNNPSCRMHYRRYEIHRQIDCKFNPLFHWTVSLEENRGNAETKKLAVNTSRYQSYCAVPLNDPTRVGWFFQPGSVIVASVSSYRWTTPSSSGMCDGVTVPENWLYVPLVTGQATARVRWTAPSAGWLVVNITALNPCGGDKVLVNFLVNGYVWASSGKSATSSSKSFNVEFFQLPLAENEHVELELYRSAGTSDATPYAVAAKFTIDFLPGGGAGLVNAAAQFASAVQLPAVQNTKSWSFFARTTESCGGRAFRMVTSSTVSFSREEAAGATVAAKALYEKMRSATSNAVALASDPSANAIGIVEIASEHTNSNDTVTRKLRVRLPCCNYGGGDAPPPHPYEWTTVRWTSVGIVGDVLFSGAARVAAAAGAAGGADGGGLNDGVISGVDKAKYDVRISGSIDLLRKERNIKKPDSELLLWESSSSTGAAAPVKLDENGNQLEKWSVSAAIKAGDYVEFSFRNRDYSKPTSSPGGGCEDFWIDVELYALSKFATPVNAQRPDIPTQREPSCTRTRTNTRLILPSFTERASRSNTSSDPSPSERTPSREASETDGKVSATKVGTESDVATVSVAASASRESTSTASHHELPAVIMFRPSAALQSSVAVGAAMSILASPGPAMDIGRASAVVALIDTCKKLREGGRSTISKNDDGDGGDGSGGTGGSNPLKTKNGTSSSRESVNVWLVSAIPFPMSLLPNVGIGKEVGAHLRTAVMVNCILLVCVCLIALGVGWKNRTKFIASSAGKRLSNVVGQDMMPGVILFSPLIAFSMKLLGFLLSPWATVSGILWFAGDDGLVVAPFAVVSVGILIAAVAVFREVSDDDGPVEVSAAVFFPIAAPSPSSYKNALRKFLNSRIAQFVLVGKTTWQKVPDMVEKIRPNKIPPPAFGFLVIFGKVLTHSIGPWQNTRKQSKRRLGGGDAGGFHVDDDDDGAVGVMPSAHQSERRYHDFQSLMMNGEHVLEEARGQGIALNSPDDHQNSTAYNEGPLLGRSGRGATDYNGNSNDCPVDRSLRRRVSPVVDLLSALTTIVVCAIQGAALVDTSLCSLAMTLIVIFNALIWLLVLALRPYRIPRRQISAVVIQSLTLLLSFIGLPFVPESARDPVMIEAFTTILAVLSFFELACVGARIGLLLLAGPTQICSFAALVQFVKKQMDKVELQILEGLEARMVVAEHRQQRGMVYDEEEEDDDEGPRNIVDEVVRADML